MIRWRRQPAADGPRRRVVHESTQATYNSPDVIVFDLGFFSGIQSLQHEAYTTSPPELIDVLLEAFDTLPHSTLTDTFITLRAAMREILRSNIGKNFKLPHLKKQANRRKSQEIEFLLCNQGVLGLAPKFLQIAARQ